MVNFMLCILYDKERMKQKTNIAQEENSTVLSLSRLFS